VKPNEMTFAGLMNAHANAGNLESAMEAFGQIEKCLWPLFFFFPPLFLPFTDWSTLLAR